MDSSSKPGTDRIRIGSALLLAVCITGFLWLTLHIQYGRTFEPPAETLDFPEYPGPVNKVLAELPPAVRNELLRLCRKGDKECRFGGPDEECFLGCVAPGGYPRNCVLGIWQTGTEWNVHYMKGGFIDNEITAVFETVPRVKLSPKTACSSPEPDGSCNL